MQTLYLPGLIARNFGGNDWGNSFSVCADSGGSSENFSGGPVLIGADDIGSVSFFYLW